MSDEKPKQWCVRRTAEIKSNIIFGDNCNSDTSERTEISKKLGVIKGQLAGPNLRPKH